MLPFLFWLRMPVARQILEMETPRTPKFLNSAAEGAKYRRFVAKLFAVPLSLANGEKEELNGLIERQKHSC